MLQALPLRPTMLELWLLKVQAALHGRGWGAVLADLDIANMLSQARAARQDTALRPLVDVREELQTATELVLGLGADLRDFVGVFNAVDYLAVVSEPGVDSTSMALALEKLDTLFERLDAIEAFPQELDALLKGAAHIQKRP